MNFFSFFGFFPDEVEKRERKRTHARSLALSPPPSLKNNNNTIGRRPLQEAPQGPRRPPPRLGGRRRHQGLPARRRRARAARRRRGRAQAGAALARRRRRGEDAGGGGVEDGARGAGGRERGGQADGEAEVAVKGERAEAPTLFSFFAPRHRFLWGLSCRLPSFPFRFPLVCFFLVSKGGRSLCPHGALC